LILRHQNLIAPEDSGKINYDPKDISDFWAHWEKHEPVQHPATIEKKHMPVGIAGDDAKYTLAGAKLICMLLSFPIQTVMRALVFLFNLCCTPESLKK